MATRKYYSEEAKNRAQVERSLIAAICIGLGVAIGTVIALLFAPEDGESFRSTITDKASDAIEEAEKTVKKLAS